jgi:cobaltochelatase CobT
MTGAEDLGELVKRVTAAAFKAVADRENLTVTYVQGATGVSEDGARLPTPQGRMDEPALMRLRGVADALAVRVRYHDEKLHRRRQPHNRDARDVFDAVEQVRCEVVGGRDFFGVRRNLAGFFEERCRARGYAGVTERHEAMLADAVALIARERMSGQPLPEAARAMAEEWRSWLESRAGPELARLVRAASDQTVFAAATLDLLRALKLITDQDAGSEQDEDQENEDQAEASDGDSEPDSTRESRESEGSMASESGDSESESAAETAASGKEEDALPGQGDDEPAGPSSREPRWPANTPIPSVYKAFTTAHDEVVDAAMLCDPGELSRLRHQLDQQLSHLQGVVAKLANRLQRRLMAKQTRSWEFDLEEGLLDSGRLSRVVVDPVHPLSFKRERDTEFRDTVVSLLIDNSGSMRGRPITIAAISADILARTLERCGVKVEILGFTTRAWKGGQSRESWVARGKPKNPGRLNDLRHIVYKSADAPWRRARPHLGLMLREGLLKENIDGEALLWAHARLIARPEQRRILMVISDGAPVDDATLSANPGNYLERHLREVIHWIETRSPVELVAIGIGHDVTRYYRRAVTLLDAEELGGTMMQALADLFDEETVSDLRRSGSRSSARAGTRATARAH